MRNSFYLHLNSQENSDLFPSNVWNDFTIEFRDPIELDGKWEIALCSVLFFSQNPPNEELLISSDICGSSYLSGKTSSCLRVVNKSEEFNSRQYVPVKVRLLNRLTINITTRKFGKPSFTATAFSCTLHLRRNG